ncbi:hypothetical protein [Frankia gtarii]|uniref:hypothetical protein n=1 Tax=Frankia gtarii TaxID=2950102 RepID=UPI0021C0190A|nr:hypothetical protein [Frankia gtarii]
MTARLPRHVAPLAVGESSALGPYQLLGRLDAGITGIVYLGRAPGGAQVAIRALHPGDALRADMRARFAAAVDRAHVLSGPHTCGVLDAAPDADRPYAVTEFVGGPTLARELTERGPLSADEIDRLARTLLETIDAAHHTVGALGDLTATDIVLSVIGPRLVDLGIAAALRPLLLSTAASGQAATTGAASGGGYVPGYGYGPAAGGWDGPAADIVAWAGIVDLAATGKASGSVEPAGRGGWRRAPRPDQNGPISAGVRRALARVRQADGASLPDVSELLALLAAPRPRPGRAGRDRATAAAIPRRQPVPTPERPARITTPPSRPGDGDGESRQTGGGRHSAARASNQGGVRNRSAERRRNAPGGGQPDLASLSEISLTLPPLPTLPPSPMLPPPPTGRLASAERPAAATGVRRLPPSSPDPVEEPRRRPRVRPAAAFAVVAAAAVAAAATAAGLGASNDDVTTGAQAPLHETRSGGSSAESRSADRAPAARPSSAPVDSTDPAEATAATPISPGGDAALAPTEYEQQEDLAAEDFALNTLRLAAASRSEDAGTPAAPSAPADRQPAVGAGHAPATTGRLDTQLPRGLLVTPLMPTGQPAAQPRPAQAAQAVGRADGATADGATANGATARLGRLPAVPVAAAAAPPATSGTAATAAQQPQPARARQAPAQAQPQAYAQTQAQAPPPARAQAAAPPAAGTAGTTPGSPAAHTAGLTPVQVGVVPLTPR